jgi:hypothetical protein
LSLINIPNDEALDLIERCLSGYGIPSSGPLDRNHTFWTWKGNLIHILGDGAKAYSELLSLIMIQGRVDGTRIKHLFSEDALHDRIRALIGELINKALENETEPEELSRELKEDAWEAWKNEFQRPVDITKHYGLIQNLVLNQPMEFGEITLENFGEENYEDFSAEIRDDLQKNDNPDKTIDQMMEKVSDYFDVDARLTLIKGKIEGYEPDRSRDVFKRRAREILNTFRFFRYFIYAPSQKAYIDFYPKLSYGISPFLMLVEDEKFNLSPEMTGRYFPYQIDDEKLEEINNIGFEVVQEILSEPPEERHDLEQSLVNSINWFGRASKDPSEDSRFFKYFIALEGLFIDRGEGGYGDKVSERVAVLLARDQETKEDIKSDLDDLYSERGQLAHLGTIEDVDQKVEEMNFYTIQSIRRFIELLGEEGWEETEEFIEWSESQFE